MKYPPCTAYSPHVVQGQLTGSRLGASPGGPGRSSACTRTGTDQAAYQLVPFWRGFLVEVLATALLLILSLLETRSINAPSAWFFPLTVGAFVGMLVFVTAPLTMTSLNAARDLGPRVMALFMGFGKVAFPGPRNGLSLMITVVGPCVGGVLGALFFDRVIRPFYPLPERPKGPVEEPGELAEGRPGPA